MSDLSLQTQPGFPVYNISTEAPYMGQILKPSHDKVVCAEDTVLDNGITGQNLCIEIDNGNDNCGLQAYYELVDGFETNNGAIFRKYQIRFFTDTSQCEQPDTSQVYEQVWLDMTNYTNSRGEALFLSSEIYSVYGASRVLSAELVDPPEIWDDFLAEYRDGIDSDELHVYFQYDSQYLGTSTHRRNPDQLSLSAETVPDPCTSCKKSEKTPQ